MTLTEARATSMLLAAAGLLDLEFPTGPARCLAPPKGLAIPASTQDAIDSEEGARIGLRGSVAWRFNAPPQDVAATLVQLMRHDLGTNARIFEDLGIDMATRRARDNVPFLDHPSIREYRMISKALAMELLTSLWLASTDSPKRVVCHCETRHGLPHRFAPPLTHDAEAHYEEPFHVLAEVSAKREITRWHYRSQLAHGLKHGRSLAGELNTTQPVYALVINGGRIDGDRRLREVYREFVEEKGLGDDTQVRALPMCTEHLAIALH